MAYEITGNYPHDQLDYAWKTLMQNHPHDSICSCSVAEVHREMVPRFEKANEVGKHVAEEAVNAMTAEMNTETFAKIVSHDWFDKLRKLSATSSYGECVLFRTISPQRNKSFHVADN